MKKHLQKPTGKSYRFLLVCLTLALSLTKLSAQDTEFWFAAPDIAEHTGCGNFDAPIILAISNCTDKQGQIQITFYNGGTPVVINDIVPAGGLYKRDITNAQKGQVENPRGSAGNVTKYGIHITSDVAVTVYYQLLAPCNQDVFTLKGSSALGKEFYVPMIHDSYYYTGPSYAPLAYDQIDIVASEDNTEVTVVPTKDMRVGVGGSSPAGTPYTKTLNRGETLKIMEHAVGNFSGAPTLAGTKITSNRPIAVTTTEDLVNTGSGADVIGDQIVPTTSLGRNYVVIKGFLTCSDRAYIVATKDGTKISVDSGSGAPVVSPVLNAGDSWKYDLGNNGNTGTAPQAIFITADKPVYCYHVSGVNGELGSGLIPSIYSIGQRQLSFYQYAGQPSNDRHHAFVVFRTGAHDKFTLSYGGSTYPISSVTSINIPGITDWKAAKIELPVAAQNKIVTIKNSGSPFSFGYFAVNTYNGGASYGYLSAFGDFKFEEITYRCIDSPITLDGGYAKSHKWWKGKKADEPAVGLSTNESYTVPGTESGYYTVKVDQDSREIWATTYVTNDPFALTTSIPTYAKINTPQNLLVTPGRSVGKTYNWTMAGATVTSATTAGTTTQWNTAGEHNVSVRVNSDLGCDTTYTQKVYVYNIMDDYAQTIQSMPVTIDVLVNDIIPGCTSPAISIDAQGSKGTASVINNKIVYTAGNAAGSDIVTYKVTCGILESTAKVHINIIEYPDNISNETCHVDAKPVNWGIEKAWSSSSGVSFYNIPLVGDLDDDEVPEIMCFGSAGATTTGAAPLLKTILVYDGKTHALKKTITIADSYVTGYDAAGYGMVKLPLRSGETKRKGLIIVACYDNYLRAYDITKANGQELVWKSTEKYGAAVGDLSTNVGFADFNNDGFPEIYIRNKVFDAETGKLLATATGGTNIGGSWAHYSHATGWKLSSPVAADMFGDSRLELILGNEIYDVNIKSRTDASQNTITRIKTIAPPTGVVTDGHAQVVDFDKDGYLDVFISNRDVAPAAGGTVSAYVWNVLKNEVSTPLRMTTNMSGKSIPLIADVNNNGKLDIVIQCATSSDNQRIRAYEYDSATKQFSFLWGIVPDEDSYSNGATLFDFNLDNMNEVLISDQKYMSIYNGSGKSHITQSDTVAVYLMDRFSFPQTTIMQYPIIADVNMDGNAEIVAVGGGTLNILKSKGAPWAPARKVWNQYMYNAVNVNDDLTIPKYQTNPAVAFAGKDGQFGTVDDVRPFNGYMIQQTVLNNLGTPLYLTPNAQLVDLGNMSYVYDANTDIMTIKNVTIKNKGAASLAPIKIAIYKNNTSTLIKKYQYTASILKDGQATFDIEINNFGSKLSIDKLILRINDDGEGNYPYQTVCETCAPNESGAFKDLELVMDGLAWIEDGYLKCEGKDAKFDSQLSEKTGFSYQWLKPDGNELSQEAKPKITNLTAAHVGQYTFEAKNTVNKLTVTHKLPHLSVATAIMSWRSDAADKNWNNINNWNNGANSATAISGFKSVPSNCTTVHIPAVADNYPSLLTSTDASKGTDKSLYKEPTVDKIVYHYGAETAYPHLLEYNKAYVQYNFGYFQTMPTTGTSIATINSETATGAGKLERNKWYAVAAPLKSMASGDFSFGGYPATWQAAHGLVSSSSGNLNSIDFEKKNTANDVNLSTSYNAMGLKIAAYSKGVAGADDHKHLENIGGILEIPYFDNAQQNSHPSHSYDPISKTSSFYYFDNATLQQLGSPVDKMKRDDEAFKFIFEGNIVTQLINGQSVPCYRMEVTAGVGNRVLIGNPFMATINMANFKLTNSAVLASDNNYFIYSDGASAEWRTYTYTAAQNGVNPLQAFAITLKNTGKSTLYFPLEGDWALTGKDAVRIPVRLQTPEALAVTVSNPQGITGDYAELSTSNSLQLDNVSKLISQEGHATPEVFFIDRTGNNYNLIQYYDREISEVGLGVKYSDTKSELILTFDRISEFCQTNNVRPILIDKLLGVEQDLTKNSTYSFRQHTAANAQSQYADKKRFAIRFAAEAETTGSEDLQVIYTNNYLQVKATLAVVQIDIYNLNGQLLFNSGTIDTTYYSRNLPLASGGYIVMIKTLDNKMTSKKIMAK